MRGSLFHPSTPLSMCCHQPGPINVALVPFSLPLLLDETLGDGSWPRLDLIWVMNRQYSTVKCGGDYMRTQRQTQTFTQTERHQQTCQHFYVPILLCQEYKVFILRDKRIE